MQLSTAVINLATTDPVVLQKVFLTQLGLQFVAGHHLCAVTRTITYRRLPQIWRNRER